LVCQYGLRAGTGTVGEIDAEGRVRWQIGGLRQPFDAQVLGPDRVLVCEHLGRAVTERNLKGEVVWKKEVPGPVVGARRLPGGNTFIVTRNRIFEVDGDGREVHSLDRPNDVLAACRLRNGQVGLVTTAGRYVQLDAGGHEIRSFSLGAMLFPMSNFEVLPRGRVLVPFYSQNRVVEFNADGRRVWEAAVARPGSVMRLSNGHTLVTSRLTRNVVEIDRAGRVVWSHTTEGRPLRASRR
jgi:outer membrane protein assembly factor BamB